MSRAVIDEGLAARTAYDLTGARRYIARRPVSSAAGAGVVLNCITSAASLTTARIRTYIAVAALSPDARERKIEENQDCQEGHFRGTVYPHISPLRT